ncbi:hypothetical protein AGMMS49546_18610 [Spirochaetia bacterium]|nr:hypothetical protein AGMMS49546_18610 [Spirochaetia bacterium]
MAIKLVRISIEKLFGQFDYTISLNQKDGVTILTGPNGYGKTTILNIVYHLFTEQEERFFYFSKLPFVSITALFPLLHNSTSIRESSLISANGTIFAWAPLIIFMLQSSLKDAVIDTNGSFEK